MTADLPTKTAAQKAALAKYEYALRQEDRYLGSVFVTAQGQRDIEARTEAAYAACKALGNRGELSPLHDFDGVQEGEFRFEPALGLRLFAGGSEFGEDGNDGFGGHGCFL